MTETSNAPLLSGSLDYLRPVALDDLERIGSRFDGGYLIPRQCLESVDALVSFGVSVDWQFEKQIRLRKPHIPIHAYDHTVNERLFVKQLLSGLVGPKTFRGKLTAVIDRSALWRDYRSFFGKEATHYRQRVHNRHDAWHDVTFREIIGRLDGHRHLLVKCDIEGSEYRVIPDLLRHAQRIDVLVLEMHDTEPFRVVFEQQMRALSQHFVLVHLHGNNYAGRAEDGVPDVLEVTFVNKRFNMPTRLREALPLSGLDAPCNPASPDLAMRFGSSPRGN